MNLELSLLELNELYLATQRLVNQYETELKEYGGDYLKSVHERSVLLRDKIQTALHDECDKLDEAVKYVTEYIDEEIEPEYDSAGFTEDDRIVNGQYRVISNEAADEDYRLSLMQDEQRYVDSMKEAQAEDRRLGNL